MNNIFPVVTLLIITTVWHRECKPYTFYHIKMLHTSPPVTTVRKHSSSSFEVKSALVPLRHIILCFCVKFLGISSANEKHMYRHCEIVIKNIWWWRVVNPTLSPHAGGQPIVGSSRQLLQCTQWVSFIMVLNTTMVTGCSGECKLSVFSRMWEEQLELQLHFTFAGHSFHCLRTGHAVVIKDAWSLRVGFFISDGTDCSGVALEVLVGYPVKWCDLQYNFNWQVNIYLSNLSHPALIWLAIMLYMFQCRVSFIGFFVIMGTNQRLVSSMAKED